MVLRVVKSRGPLLQAGKLLYRLSKDSSNDALFRSVWWGRQACGGVHKALLRLCSALSACSLPYPLPCTLRGAHAPTPPSFALIT